MTTFVPAAMVAPDVATQAELDSVAAAAAAAAALKLAGDIVQTVRTQTGAVATGTTLIPVDDTIPQITEGNEYMTATITPTSATNLLRIDVVLNATGSTTSGNITAALFQDSAANALAAVTQVFTGAGFQQNVKLTHYMTAGTTSPTTFRVRAGLAVAGTLTFNGASGARLFGGVYASSITVTEIKT